MMTYLGAFFLLVLGVAGVVAGGADDSPGLQLIGLLLAIGGIVLAVRNHRRRR